MKKLYLALFSGMISLGFTAQLANLGLENWTTSIGYSDPNGWQTVNSYSGFLGIVPPVTKVTSGVSEGSAAAQMITRSCSSCAGFGAPDPLPGFINQAVAYTTKPTSIQFDYQYAPVSGDWGAVVVQLTKWDPTGDSSMVIAEALDTIALVSSSWKTKTVSFIYDPLLTTITPDTLSVSFVGSIGGLVNDPTFPAPQVGTKLKIDAISVADVAASIQEIETIAANVFVSGRQINIQLIENLNGSIEIIDLTGKIVLTRNFNSNFTTIDASQFSKGIYLVNITSDGKRTVKKIVIE